MFFQVHVALSAFTSLIDFQIGHTYGKLCLSWVSWLSERSADVEIDDVTIVLCLPFQMLSGDNTEHRRVNWGHTVKANLVMDTGENKFVMERHLLHGWWWSFQEKNKPDKYIDLFHDACHFSRIILGDLKQEQKWKASIVEYRSIPLVHFCPTLNVNEMHAPYKWEASQLIVIFISLHIWHYYQYVCFGDFFSSEDT